MTARSKRHTHRSYLKGLVLSVGLFGIVACQSHAGLTDRRSPRLSLDGTQLSMLEQTALPPTTAQSPNRGSTTFARSELTTSADGKSVGSKAAPQNITQNPARPLITANNVASAQMLDQETTSAARRKSLNSDNVDLAKSRLDQDEPDSIDEEADDEGEDTALVEEFENDAEKEILDQDSSRSPEEMAELLQNSGIEGHFALCDGSVYMDEWQRIFESQFIANNKHRFKKSSQLRKALDEARSEEYTRLLLPTLSNLDFDYPVVINEDVIKWIQYFQTRGRKAFVTWLRRAEDVIPQAVPVLEKHGLPKDLVYLAMIESGFNNKATSVARAAGTWQFMRATGRHFGLKLNDYVDERRDPEKATVAAARYLTYLYTMFGDWHLAAASYNAGEGRVSRSMRGQADKSFFGLSAARRLPNETRNYVPKLIAAMVISKNPTRFGFEVTEGSRALRTRGLALEKSVRLTDLASAINVDLKIIESLNPELRLGVTPPGQPQSPYILRVPESSYATAIAAVDALPQASRSVQVAARVKRRETASQFARRYGISLATLLKANPSIRPNVRLSKGQKVMIPVALGTGQYERLTRDEKTKVRKSRSSAAKTRSLKMANRRSGKTKE